MAEGQGPKPTTLPNVVVAILVGVLGAAAVTGIRHTDDAGANAKDEKASQERKPEGKKEPGTLRLDKEASLFPLRDFLSTSDPPKSGKWECKRFDADDCLIATVPDPIDSQFGYLFDHLIEVFSRVASEMGYIADRSWLPWALDRTFDEEHISVASPDSKFGRVQSHVREEFPGVLLFRSSKSEAYKKCLVIFLVGEHPTTGIDKRAFRKALKLREECLDGDPPKVKVAKVKVVGPVFSGSQTSLKLAMEAWLGDHQETTFRVISGSATGIVTTAPDGGHTFAGLSGTTYFATVAPKEVLLKACLCYLIGKYDMADFDQNIDYRALEEQKIALLEESATGFGSSAPKARTILKKSVPRQQDHEEVETADRQRDPWVKITFPLHISRLKAIYDQQLRQKEEQIGLTPADPLARQVGKAPEVEADIVPAQDPVTTAVTTARLLEAVSAQILREKIRYVVIVASDPRDKIFLVSWIREHCPGVRCFVLVSDNLLTLPENAYYLKGTLVVSTYPLLAANQSWTGAAKKQVYSFPNQTAQGTYNACLFLLAEDGTKPTSLLEYVPPRAAPGGKDGVKPPVWITMIDQTGGLVPVHFYSDYDDGGYLEPGPAPTYKDGGYREPGPAPAAAGDGPQLPDAYLLLWALVCAGCFGVLFDYLWRDKPTVFLPFRWRTWEQGLHFGVLFASLQLLLYGAILPWWLAGRSAGGSVWRVGVGVSLAGVTVVLWLVLQVALGVLVFRIFSRRKWLALVVFVLLVVPVAPLALVLTEAFGRDSGPWNWLWAVRAADLGTGVSPLLPLICLGLGFFAWAYFQLKQSDLAEAHRVECPFPRAADSCLTALRKAHQEMMGQLTRPYCMFREYPLSFAAAALALAAGCVWLWRRRLPIVDGFWWDVFFHTAFGILFALCVFTLARFCLLWSQLKRLLRELAMTPLVPAFSRLPAKVRVTFGGYFYSERPLRLSHLLLVGRKLREVVGPWKELDAALVSAGVTDFKTRAVARQGNRLCDSIAKLEPDNGQAAASGYARHWRRLSWTARYLLRAFQGIWPRRTVAEAFGDKKADHPTAEDAGGEGGGTAPPVTFRGRKERRRRARLEKERRRRARLEAAEDFVAMHLVTYISQFIIQLRTFIWSLTVCSTLLLLAVTSYPFQPERLLLLPVLALCAAISGFLVYVLVQMNRDDILSCIAGTKPGEFSPDWGFVRSIFTYILPAATIIAIQLSGKFRFIVEPILRVLK
jgi:hypothetical protein